MVYRARDEHLQRNLAIKVLPSSAVKGESARRRFRREPLTLARLNHPNIEIFPTLKLRGMSTPDHGVCTRDHPGN